MGGTTRDFFPSARVKLLFFSYLQKVRKPDVQAIGNLEQHPERWAGVVAILIGDGGPADADFVGQRIGGNTLSLTFSFEH